MNKSKIFTKSLTYLWIGRELDQHNLYNLHAKLEKYYTREVWSKSTWQFDRLCVKQLYIMVHGYRLHHFVIRSENYTNTY